MSFSLGAEPETSSGAFSPQYVPSPPTYGDTAMWITADGDSLGTGADVFYVVSTWEEDWQTADGAVCHYADVWNTRHRSHMAKEINGVAKYMADGNRFFAPFYRHATIDAFLSLNEDTIHSRTRLPMADVCEAFDYFQRHRDRSRPFVIAGFSQGGMAVVELLKHMADTTYEQMAAAYVMGYKVTPQDTATCHRIRPAMGETDIGVTICYNTVKDLKYVNPVIAETCFGINPVNWRTDASPVLLHDSITVTLSPERHVLVVDGYSGSEYRPYRNFINVGDIHSCEPWLYSECLRKNIAARTREWRKCHPPCDQAPVCSGDETSPNEHTDVSLMILDTDIASSTDDLFALEMLCRYEADESGATHRLQARTSHRRHRPDCQACKILP